MLLTSSQVSVAISSSVVFLFTTALFLSGYAVQQKTVRDLRAAVKPKPRPTDIFFLPHQFKTAPDPVLDVTNKLGVEDGLQGQTAEEVDAVEVKISTPDSSDGDAEVMAPEKEGTSKQRGPQDDTTSEDPSTGSQKVIGQAGVIQESANPVPGPQRGEKEAVLPQGTIVEKPLSRAERRKQIKEDLMKGSGEGTMGGYQRRMW